MADVHAEEVEEKKEVQMTNRENVLVFYK